MEGEKVANLNFSILQNKGKRLREKGQGRKDRLLGRQERKKREDSLPCPAKRKRERGKERGTNSSNPPLGERKKAVHQRLSKK